MTCLHSTELGQMVSNESSKAVLRTEVENPTRAGAGAKGWFSPGLLGAVLLLKPGLVSGVETNGAGAGAEGTSGLGLSDAVL